MNVDVEILDSLNTILVFMIINYFIKLVAVVGSLTVALKLLFSPQVQN
jgi:hypothetical protein